MEARAACCTVYEAQEHFAFCAQNFDPIRVQIALSCSFKALVCDHQRQASVGLGGTRRGAIY